MTYNAAGEWTAAAALAAPPLTVTPPTPTTIAATGDPDGGRQPVQTVTLHGIELARVGVWPASTGPANVTLEHLQAAIDAAADPDVDHAPVHFGHVDPRFPALSDGEPAVGWVVPRRIEGDRLIGDLVDVPRTLADIIPRAYRRRSIEAAFGLRTAGGKLYAMALTGLGLLGATPPAVKGLADVVGRYSTAAAPIEATFSAVEVTGELGDTPTTAPATTLPAQGPGHDGHVTTPSTPQGGSPVTSPSTPPRSQFTDDRLRGLLGLAADADVTALQQQLSTIAPPAAPASPATPAPVAPVAPTAPVAGAPAPITPVAPVAPAAPAAPVAPAVAPAGDVATAPVAVAASAGLPAGMVAVPADQYAAMMQGAQAGTAAFAAITQSRQQATVATAMREGRISAAEAPAFLTQMQAPGGEAITTAMLNALQPGRYPVGELGTGAAATGAQQAADAAFDAFDSAVFGLPMPTQPVAGANPQGA